MTQVSCTETATHTVGGPVGTYEYGTFEIPRTSSYLEDCLFPDDMMNEYWLLVLVVLITGQVRRDEL